MKLLHANTKNMHHEEQTWNKLSTWVNMDAPIVVQNKDWDLLFSDANISIENVWSIKETQHHINISVSKILLFHNCYAVFKQYAY